MMLVALVSLFLDVSHMDAIASLRLGVMVLASNKWNAKQYLIQKRDMVFASILNALQ